MRRTLTVVFLLNKLVFGARLVMAQGASVRQKYVNYVSRIFFPVLSAITIGAGCIGAPVVLADYKED